MYDWDWYALHLLPENDPTYLLLRDSVFYNLRHSAGDRVVIMAVVTIIGSKHQIWPLILSFSFFLSLSLHLSEVYAAPEVLSF